MRAALLVVVLLVSGCFGGSWMGGERIDGSGDVAERTVEVDGVRSVRLAVPGELVIERGQAPLVISGDDNLVERIEVEENDGTLTIGTPDGVSFRPDAPLRLRVGVERLEGLRISGSGEASARDISSDALDVQISGSGDVALEGRVDELTVRISGSGEIEAADLIADLVSIRISGSGDAEVHAVKTLDVRVSGSGSIRYSGSPEVTQQVSGSGEVSRLDD